MINIAYASDEKYAWITAVSIISLLNNNCNEEFTIFILDFDIMNESKKLIQNMLEKSAYKVVLKWIDTTFIKTLTSDVAISNRLGIATFGRLFLSKLLPNNISIILYIDCDTIINGDIKELFYRDYTNYAIAGVKECVNKYFAKTVGFDPTFPYLNAGILIMNLEFLRKKNYFEIFIKELRRSKPIYCFDQDIVNICIDNDEKFILELKYNFHTPVAYCTYKEIISMRHQFDFYSENEVLKAKEKPIIVHFCSWDLSGSRPWQQNNNHPYSDLFLKYLKETPFVNHQFEQNKVKVLDKIIQLMPKFIKFKILYFRFNFRLFRRNTKQMLNPQANSR